MKNIMSFLDLISQLWKTLERGQPCSPELDTFNNSQRHRVDDNEMSL